VAVGSVATRAGNVSCRGPYPGKGNEVHEIDTARARPRRMRGLLVYLSVAVLAAGAGIGVTLEVHSLVSGSALASLATPQPRMDSSQVYREVAPSVVDVSADLQFLNETAEGTGFVIDSARGLVLTNNHVIDDATSVTVTIALTGRTYPATVLGYDLPADIALLRIKPVQGLAAALIGHSDALRTGSQVLALGNEAGQGGPPSQAPGVISSTGRSIVATDRSSGLTETLHGMLQTSADIRPGDSGGPLANAAGQVVGVNTAAGDASPGSSFAGYAIPIDTALAIAQQIGSSRPGSGIHLGMPAFLGVLLPASGDPDPQQQAGAGTTRHGPASGLGCVTSDSIRFGAVPPRIAPATSGALVDGVVCDTPAARAGLEPGDVITAFAGHPVSSADDLTGMLDHAHPGGGGMLEWVGLGGETRTAYVTLGTGPAG